MKIILWRIMKTLRDYKSESKYILICELAKRSLTSFVIFFKSYFSIVFPTKTLIIGVKTIVVCSLKTDTYVLRNVFLHFGCFHLCSNIIWYTYKPRWYGLLHTYAMWYSLLLLTTNLSSMLLYWILWALITQWQVFVYINIEKAMIIWYKR